MFKFTMQLGPLWLAMLVDISGTIDWRPSTQMIQLNPSRCETTSSTERKR